MARGRTHALATVIAGGAISPALVIVGGAALEQAAAFAFGCLAGLIINPDLDVRHFTHAENVMRRSSRRLGPLLSGLWYALWWPYARLVPHHRNPISHFPILGTAVRLLYLGAIGLGLYWVAGLIVSLPAPALPGPLFWWAAAGLAVVDALHTLMDVL